MCGLRRSRDAVGACGDGIRKSKAPMELNLTRSEKNNKGLRRGFYRYIHQKRQGVCTPLINEKRELISTDAEEAEILSKVFATVFSGSRVSHVSCFSGSWVSHVSCIPKPLCRGQGSKIPCDLSKEQVQDCLMRLNVYKTKRANEMHPSPKRTC